jgi:membrane-associated phospholipid phosphatase
MDKSLAKFFSYLFHPLAMTSLAVLILLYSRTSLSVLQPDIKRFILIITVLFTFVFPASMIIILYIARMINNTELQERKERVLPMVLTIILYLFFFFVMRSIPQLSQGHVVFFICPPVALIIVLVFNRFMKPSIHMLGIGMLLGMVLVLIMIYGAMFQGVFIVIVLAGGILGSSRLVLKLHTPGEVLAGFSIGFFVTIIAMTLNVIPLLNI